ncbi:hypothetical protein JK358_38830, partial [Nocardia sp. 2]|nr:hypothetical protein [Nocardia acididurans]
IRGFRIEPGEIQAVLTAYPGVTQAVVVTSHDAGDTRLVAYVVADTDTETDPSEIRRYARERLPEYMVPAAIMLLDQLPLTVNGKLDKRALPTPEFISGTPYRAPSTPAEQALAEIFANVLRLDKQ